MHHQFSWPLYLPVQFGLFPCQGMIGSSFLLVSRTYYLSVRRKLKPKVCKPKTKTFISSIIRTISALFAPQFCSETR